MVTSLYKAGGAVLLSLLWMALLSLVWVTAATGGEPTAAGAAEAQSAEPDSAGETQIGRGVEATSVPHLVVLRISGDLLQPIIDKQLDRQSPVNDVILGTRVVGVARTRGIPTIALEEDATQAVFRVVLTGSTASRTTGRNGPAIIRSRSTTTFRASKQIVFEAGKGFYATPARIAANTQTVTEEIDSTRRGIIGRLVQRRARREVEESRAAVNRIVQRKAERQISAAFDKYLESYVARLNRSVDLRQTLATLRNDSWEPIYACCSTRDYLQIALSKERGETTPIQLPALHAPKAPLQLWLHQSLVGENISEALARFNQTSSGVKDFVSWTLQAVPTAIGDDLTTAVADSASAGPANFSYALVGEWIVLQIGAPTRTAAKL